MLYDIIVLESFTLFYVTITVTVSYNVTDVWQCNHNVNLTITLDFQNKDIKRKKKRILNKKTSVQASYI